MNKKLVFISILLICAIVFGIFAMDSRLKIVNYSIESEEISSPVRIAFISDLHSCKYGGEDQSDLINAIRAQDPDFVLIGGDAFDRDLDTEAAFTALEAISDEYPCYYSLGNHERDREDLEYIKEKVESFGIKILSGETITLDEQNGILLTGMDDPSLYKTEIYDQNVNMRAALEHMKELNESKGEGFSILLFHRPENFEDYAMLNFDLVLTGHAHGGQWRIPGVLNGLYAPHQGVFPKYAGGEYVLNGCTMIVSRGLAKECNWVPRIFNRPELVIIDIE